MPNTTTTGAAGEHYVMSRLLRRGMIAALAPAGVPNADIVVTDTLGDRLCAVQVKARTVPGPDRGWHMRARHEQIRSPNIFYCFVAFETEPPGCWIVPSAVVADAIALSHTTWLAAPGARGQAHNEHSMRRFCESYAFQGLDAFPDGWLDQYREAWHLIEGATR